MNVITCLSKISKWSDAADWHSWVVHGIIAIPITVISAGLGWGLMKLGVHPAATVGIVATFTAYAIRELEQRAHEMMAGVPPKDTDHLWDLVTPTFVALLVAWRLLG